MNIKASQITSNLIFVQQQIQAANKETTKPQHHWLFVWGIHQWLGDFPQKEPVMQKLFIPWCYEACVKPQGTVIENIISGVWSITDILQNSLMGMMYFNTELYLADMADMLYTILC